MTRHRRRVVLLLLIAMPFIAVAAWALVSPFQARYILDTRRFLLALKADGHAPGVSWPALAGRMGPRWMQRDGPTFVEEAGRGAPPCPVHWRTPLGLVWGGEDDGRVLDHLMLEQLGGRIYDRGEARIQPGDTVLDVGGHLGTFTRYALRRGAARVIVIEPMPDLAACLERTFAAEIAAGIVTVARVAAWRENTSLGFDTGAQSTMGRVHEGVGALQVPGEAIDALVRRLGIAKVDFIKMDIEGAEVAALEGAAHVLRAHHPRLAICIYHGAGDAEAVPQAVFAAAPYQVSFRQPFQAYFH
jgi:FkbM family methyltransferase